MNKFALNHENTTTPAPSLHRRWRTDDRCRLWSVLHHHKTDVLNKELNIWKYWKWRARTKQIWVLACPSLLLLAIYISDLSMLIHFPKPLSAVPQFYSRAVLEHRCLRIAPQWKAWRSSPTCESGTFRFRRLPRLGGRILILSPPPHLTACSAIPMAVHILAHPNLEWSSCPTHAFSYKSDGLLARPPPGPLVPPSPQAAPGEYRIWVAHRQTWLIFLKSTLCGPGPLLKSTKIWL